MIPNLVGTEWKVPDGAASSLPVFNPATGAEIERVPLSGAADVDRAVAAAVKAFPPWSRTPVMERVRLMFAFKALLERSFEELAAITTRHHGKTLDEARGEVRRGIEVVDFACGAPTLLQGRTLRDVSGGVDQDLYRYPIGVCAGIPPFNFPVMIPLWMFPLAVVARLGPLKDAAAKLVVGPGDEPGVQVGPLIRAEHRDKVAGYVDRGIAEGAELLVDGRAEMKRPGFFLGPTILDRVTATMAVGREEIFGPVLSVARPKTLDQA